jgi:NAD(P)H-hydrate repair Nnr-like enzyme with NAD(P)H-hydrate dehydratase domain
MGDVLTGVCAALVAQVTERDLLVAPCLALGLAAAPPNSLFSRFGFGRVTLRRARN